MGREGQSQGVGSQEGELAGVGGRVVRFGEVRTVEPEYAESLISARRYAATNLNLLIGGESGCGKELVARAVHESSPRKNGPFVAINCAGLSEHLIESELFGHVRGAFTGAQGDREGALVAASGGTLFLDEVGDAPTSVQLALLRCLETQSVRPVGAEKERGIDIRVVAATSRPLSELMRDGSFRIDLYFRLSGASINVPPLRRRPRDLPHLVQELLGRLGYRGGIKEDAITYLQSQPWPGNVRELKNALERAVANAEAASPGGAPRPLWAALFREPSGALPPRPSDAASHQAPESYIRELRPNQVDEIALAQTGLESHLATQLAHLSEQAYAYAQSELLITPTSWSRRRVTAWERALLLVLVQEATNQRRLLPAFLQKRHRALFRPGWTKADEGRALRALLGLVGGLSD